MTGSSGAPLASGADPRLVSAWLTARSHLRGLPAPILDHGGLRVETGSPQELRRYMFADACDGLRALAQTIVTPAVFLKACIPAEALRRLSPERWTLLADRYVMTVAGSMTDATPPLAGGYTLNCAVARGMANARISAPDGALAASGWACAGEDVFIYDRIETDAAHRRRGLGRAVMAALQKTKPQADLTEVLVATGDGRALYESLGWRVQAPYSTVVIESPDRDR